RGEPRRRGDPGRALSRRADARRGRLANQPPRDGDPVGRVARGRRIPGHDRRPRPGRLDPLSKESHRMSTVRTAVTMSLDPADLPEVVEIFKTFIKDVQEK